MRQFGGNRFLRGLVFVAVFSAVIVLLSLEESVQTARALLGVAFFLAVAYFCFLAWRERRSDIETWPERSRRLFYGAIVLAVAAVGVYLGVGANGVESVAFVLVLGACSWVAVRVWRRERRLA
ncbi:MAG: hypothetical protein EXQ77_01600 [Thermoleophilia bacterium]|nr:hypothetical protein [Thermoleophilia bacterium]